MQHQETNLEKYQRIFDEQHSNMMNYKVGDIIRIRSLDYLKQNLVSERTLDEYWLDPSTVYSKITGMPFVITQIGSMEIRSSSTYAYTVKFGLIDEYDYPDDIDVDGRNLSRLEIEPYSLTEIFLDNKTTKEYQKQSSRLILKTGKID